MGRINTIQECYNDCENIREEMDSWLAQSVILDPPGPNGGGEDEANYALAWFLHCLVTGNQTVLRHFADLKSALVGWIARECLHGYEPEVEAHHGTEPFLLFMPRYIGLVPGDLETTSMLIDAAEHIRNWVKDVPAWYDYDRVLFTTSIRTVHKDEKIAYEVAEHFRFIHIVLAVYRIMDENRCLDWSLRYERKCAERLIAAESPSGERVADAFCLTRFYRSFALLLRIRAMYYSIMVGAVLSFLWRRQIKEDSI